MNPEDVRKVVKWFEAEISNLEAAPNYEEIKEGIERLKKTVDDLKGGLDDFTDGAFSGEMGGKGRADVADSG